MKDLQIVWQRLVNDAGTTCPRCEGTGEEVYRAVERLTAALQPLGVRPTLEVRALDPAAFTEQPSESNRIWVAGRPLESWVDGQTGSSRCCDECGDNDCRTLEVGGQSYEVIPSELLIRAGLVAASTLLGDASATVPESGVSNSRSPIMKTVQIFDPAMCCSTGVCGADVDQALVEFAADVDWLKKQGVTVERFNLAQQPQAFASRSTIRDLLHEQGEAALPVILVDDEVKHRGVPYPSRAQLAQWVGIKLDQKPLRSTLGVSIAVEPAKSSCCGPADTSAASTKAKCC